MVSKKKKKIILISITSLVLVAAIAISAVFLVRKKKNKVPDSGPVAEQTGNSSSSNATNKAIADGLVSSNYNGVYIYTALDVEYAEGLSYQEKQAILANKQVLDFNSLKDKLKQEEKLRTEKAGELLVLQNGNLNKTTGIENPKPVYGSSASYVGDDNLSLVTVNNTGHQYFISLNYSSKDDAIAVNGNISYDSKKQTLYIFEKIYSKKAGHEDLHLLNITYIYELYETNEDFDDSAYDF